MKKLMIFSFLASCLVMAGCNTIQGVGKDIKKGGEAIEKVAK